TPSPVYDTVRSSTGNVTIESGVNINATGTFTGATGQVIKVIDANGTSPAINGTFANLNQGGSLPINATSLIAFYDGGPTGGDNDLVLVGPISINGTNGPDNYEVRRTGSGLNTDNIEVLLNGSVV